MLAMLASRIHDDIRWVLLQWTCWLTGYADATADIWA